jgi:hypothetical protein
MSWKCMIHFKWQSGNITMDILNTILRTVLKAYKSEYSTKYTTNKQFQSYIKALSIYNAFTSVLYSAWKIYIVSILPFLCYPPATICIVMDYHMYCIQIAPCINPDCPLYCILTTICIISTNANLDTIQKSNWIQYKRQSGYNANGNMDIMQIVVRIQYKGQSGLIQGAICMQYIW